MTTESLLERKPGTEESTRSGDTQLARISKAETDQLYDDLGLVPPSNPELQESAAPEIQVRSPYLVKRLTETSERNLFSHVKFHCVKAEIERLGLAHANVLDVGCGLQVARRYLADLGIEMSYFGIDYEAGFSPDAVVDLLALEGQSPELPWQPDVLIMLDVLEHLHEDKAVLEKILCRIKNLCPPSAKLILTLPQMYRLDRFKLPHLHYPEHKIRLTQREWCELVETHFSIERVRGFGVLSVVPYLPMASSKYTPENRLGRLFSYLRGTFFEWPPFKPVDLFLSRVLGRIPWLNTFTNDILIVANPRTNAKSAAQSSD